jgi:hypothetical protein
MWMLVDVGWCDAAGEEAVGRKKDGEGDDEEETGRGRKG